MCALCPHRRRALARLPHAPLPAQEYPNTKRLCGLLEPNVAHLMTEQREDLKLMATRYHAMLVKRQKTIPQEEDDKYNPRAVGLAPPRKVGPVRACVAAGAGCSLLPPRAPSAPCGSCHIPGHLWQHGARAHCCCRAAGHLAQPGRLRRSSR